MLVSNLFIILWVKALLKYDFIVTFHYKRGSFVLPINNNLTAIVDVIMNHQVILSL